MISIFIMYSSDRKEQLDLTISFLEQMELYEKCQKTLVVDSKTNISPKDFRVIEVPRINNQFCWSDMWEAGVATARFDNILYLDSDRLLPSNYLSILYETLKDGVFAFTSRHFMVNDYSMSLEEFRHLVQSPFEDFVFSDQKFSGRVKYEPRFKEPFPGPGKNVMSGNTAFTKETYYDLGGVDRWYCGHGAYADTDFHMAAGVAGCDFIDLEVPEVHCHHHKLDVKSNPLSIDEIYLLSLDNFIYYVAKWGLPLVLAENIAYECRLVKDPSHYVLNKFKEYAKVKD